MRRKYENIVVDNATLDDVMLFIVKGSGNEGTADKGIPGNQKFFKVYIFIIAICIVGSRIG